MLKLVLTVVAVSLAGIGLAEAHPFHTDGSGHALFGIELALAMVAIGLWTLQLGPRALAQFSAALARAARRLGLRK